MFCPVALGLQSLSVLQSPGIVSSTGREKRRGEQEQALQGFPPESGPKDWPPVNIEHTSSVATAIACPRSSKALTRRVSGHDGVATRAAACRQALRRFGHLRSAAGVRHRIWSSPSTGTRNTQLGAAVGLALGSGFLGASGPRNGGAPASEGGPASQEPPQGFGFGHRKVLGKSVQQALTPRARTRAEESRSWDMDGSLSRSEWVMAARKGAGAPDGVPGALAEDPAREDRVKARRDALNTSTRGRLIAPPSQTGSAAGSGAGIPPSGQSLHRLASGRRGFRRL
jgi:hypothetical protein